MTTQDLAPPATDDPREIKARKAADVAATTPIDFAAFAASVKDYTLEKVSALTGVELPRPPSVVT